LPRISTGLCCFRGNELVTLGAALPGYDADAVA
jgi:hypothetical protein